jgi:hypothetical protein
MEALSSDTGYRAVPDAPTSEAGDPKSRWFPTTIRVLTVLAASLAFGVVGLVVAGWHLIRGRQPQHPLCGGCRRRRNLTLAATFAMAGLVVVGSGLAISQDVSSPGLPACGIQSPDRPKDVRDRLPTEAARTVWLETRQVLTAPVSGLVRHYAQDRGGGLCQADSMTLAFLPSEATDSNVAVGSVVLTDNHSSINKDDGGLAAHESRHVTQWAALTLTAGPLTLPSLYAVDEAFFPYSRNHFERAADLEDGGYPAPDDTRPRPQWLKVGAIALLLFATGRRRLRWASRVLTGGTAAAAAHQPGRCPLHTPGWFRPRAAS